MSYIRFYIIIDDVSDELIEKKRVSFSQYSVYLKCPHKWELDYVQDKREKDQTVHTTFGTAIHYAIQNYLTQYFGGTFKNPTNRSISDIVYNDFVSKFTETYQEVENQSKDEFTEFCIDGRHILYELFKPDVFQKYFSKDDYELVGIEVPLNADLINNVEFVGFIDVLLKYKATNRYKIIDIKTSSAGWNKYTKEDEGKYVQLLLYKHVYSNRFKVNEEDIDVEFFIVKRRITQSSNYFASNSRIQTFVPSNGKRIIRTSITKFVDFLNDGFNPDGSYKTNHFIQNPGPYNKNCKYCQYYKTECDGRDEVID